jgi:hypothetical protein
MVYDVLNNILRASDGVAEMNIEFQKPRATGLTPRSAPEERSRTIRR